MKKRDEIDAKYKINTADLFTNDSKFNEEFTKVNKEMSGISKYKGHLLDNAKTLYEALKFDRDISSRIERLFIYAHLNNDFDLSEKRANELYGRVLKLNKEYMTESSYITNEILKCDYEKILEFIKKYDSLSEFEVNLREIFRLKNHILSDSEELLLKKISDSFRLPEVAHSKLLDTDLEFGTIKDEFGKKIKINSVNYATYIESKDRRVRKDAFKTFYKGYQSVINTTSELLGYEIKNNNNLANLRGYSSALEASLNGNEVDPKIYDTLINSINNHLEVIHKQWTLRKKIMGISDLHIYDTYVPLVQNYDKKYSFEEAKDLVLKSLSVLGSDYNKVLTSAFAENWIDVYPSKNKRGGGYCTSCYLTHPYVFLNFDERYDEVSTIAHELGHAMHFYYAIKNNYYQNYYYSIFVAEVASQVNELLLSFYMLDNSKNNDEKIFLVDELIKRFKASVIRQTMFAEFERDMHEKEQHGEIITKELLSEHYYMLNKKYYGDDVILDEDIKYEWSRIPHFFYDFYVYQYSTGYIAALKLANDIYNKKEGSLDKYLKFLSLGCTVDPVNSLKIAGVDLTDVSNYDDAFKVFDNYLNKFAKLNEKE